MFDEYGKKHDSRFTIFNTKLGKIIIFSIVVLITILTILEFVFGFKISI